MRGAWTAIATALYVCGSVFAESWVNTHYSREVDLAKSYVKESHMIVAKNTGEKPQKEYRLRIDDGVNSNRKLAVFVASLLENPVILETDQDSQDPSLHIVTFPIPIAPESEVEFQIRAIYTSALTPFPEKLAMSDTQTLLFRLNKYAYSEYDSQDYTLIFSGIAKGQELQLLNETDSTPLPGNNTETLPFLKPRVDDKSLVYGPVIVETIPAFTIQPMGLHYDHNRPLPKVHNLQRSIWIPALESNQISFEEYYELTNDAAELSTGFLRVDWMKGRYESIRNHFAISQLEVKLPEGDEPQGIYYTDKVGQVSTSKVYLNHLVMQPRFPIFGGWNYNFTIGWNSKIGDYVHQLIEDKETYIIKFPLLNAINDITYDNVLLEFYLPEDAEFIGFSSAVEYEELTIGNDLSYLDVSDGHVKITVKFSNLIDDLGKIQVFLKYKYSHDSYVWKVLKISIFVFIGLLSYYLLALVDLSINKEVKPTKEQGKHKGK